MEIHILGNCRARNYENFLNVHYGYLNIWMEVSGAHTLGLPSFSGVLCAWKIYIVGSIQFSTGKKICTLRFCIFSKVYDPLFRNLKSPHKSGMGKFFYDVIIGQSPIITGQTLIARKIQNFWCHQISKWIKYSNSPRSADEKNGIICQNWITRTHVNNPFKLQ